jgi:hypothetical protein
MTHDVWIPHVPEDNWHISAANSRELYSGEEQIETIWILFCPLIAKLRTKSLWKNI